MESKSASPLVSYIVLSYNHEKYIGQTIKSIIEQTVQDFEIVVIDDASTDRSTDVVRSFGDPRIKLHINERNTKGPGSQIRALGIAQGRYLANLDSDDWIAPQKTARQLAYFQQNPDVDLAATYAYFVDATGNRHPNSDELERPTNKPHDLNSVDAWIVQNPVCTSSTMLRRSVYERIGYAEPALIRAGDYEFWTRAVFHGCRFGLIHEPLTFYRVHSTNVTHLDPMRSYLEIAYLLQKNIFPIIEAREMLTSLATVIDWIVTHEQFKLLVPATRYRLLGVLLNAPHISNFAEYQQAILGNDENQSLLTVGRRFHNALHLNRKLAADIESLTEARDWHRQQSENWHRTWDTDSKTLNESLQRQQEQSDMWRAKYEALSKDYER